MGTSGSNLRSSLTLFVVSRIFAEINGHLDIFGSICLIFTAAARWAEVVIMSKKAVYVCVYVLDTFIQMFDRHRETFIQRFH